MHLEGGEGPPAGSVAPSFGLDKSGWADGRRPVFPAGRGLGCGLLDSIVGRERSWQPRISNPVMLVPLFLHLYFLSRPPGLDIEIYRDSNIPLLLGGEESWASEFLRPKPPLSKTPFAFSQGSLLGVVSEGEHVGFCPGLTLCPGTGHRPSAPVCARPGSGRLGSPSWL